MSTTQNHLSITGIAEDILLLKQGGGALVLQVSAVNFGLLSDKEQLGIIFAFAQMLNSLSFTIQIVIHSERLNIASYITLLDKAQSAQTNSLLAQMMADYKQFVQATIKDNEVLDKKFYIVVPLFNLELGLSTSKAVLQQKVKTILLPRRDQVIRQLNRVGLKATQLTKQKLIELFYDIYNGAVIEKTAAQTINPEELNVKLKNPQPITTFNTGTQPTSQAKPTEQSSPPIVTQGAKTHPFVVEELE